MGLERRADYDWGVLLESEVEPDPVAQLRRWLQQAEDAGLAEPNAMVLCTVDATGRPTARNVLLRGLDDEGHLTFYTNRRSRKGADLQRTCASVLVAGRAPAVRTAWRTSCPTGATPTRVPTVTAGCGVASQRSSVIPDRGVGRRVRGGRRRFRDGPSPSRRTGAATVQATSSSSGKWPSRLHDRLHYFRRGVHWCWSACP